MVDYYERENYQGKLILGQCDSEGRVIIFATNQGGYTEDGANNLQDLIEKVKELMKEYDYKVEDLQNGVREKDARIRGYYLNCARPLDDAVYNYLVHEIKKE